MLAQRGADLAGRRTQKARSAPAARPPGAPAAPGPAQSPTRRKLSFNEKHALETLPTEIDALGGRIRVLQARLGDPSFYGRDPEAFAEATAALAAAQSRLAAAEERWLELELLREELAGG